MSDRNDFDQELNIALLIDADNASPVHLDEVLLVLGELGTINIRRAYGNWAKPSLKGWGELTGLHSIIPMQQLDRKSTRLNSSHAIPSRMPSSA